MLKGLACARLRSFVRRFIAQKSGQIGITFAFALVPAVLLAGGAVDVGNVYLQQSKLQVAADAAALAATAPKTASDNERITIAQNVFKANVAATRFAGITPTVTVSGDTVAVDASSAIETPFLGVASITTMDVSAGAKAKGRATTSTTALGKACILALDPNSSDGIHLQGDNQVNYADCWAHTNSTTATAINANGNNAKAVGKGHCAVGGWTQTHSTFSPEPKSGCLTVPDPFAAVAAPTKATTCKASNLALKKGTFTLEPGRYCGGIDVKAGASVTFKPGIYYIDNGVFNVQSGSSVSGSNVMFYLAGAASRFQIIGGGTTNLSGRTSGSSWEGFLIMANPNANPGGESNIQGGGTFIMQGVIYVPTQRIEVSGNGDVNNASISVFGMVARDFYFRGNGIFNTKRHNGSGNIPDIMPNLPLEEQRLSTLQ